MGYVVLREPTKGPLVSDTSNIRRWITLGVLVLPVVVLSVDITVLGFAVPSLSADLEPSGSQMLWIVDVYGFMLAGLLVLMGVLGDRIGRRRLLTIGAAAFGLASMLAAVAPTADVLIAARALMGIGGATLMPSTLSIIRNLFQDAAERRRAIAVWAAAFAGGAGLGPLVGGILLEHFWWGSVFLINVPLMTIIILATPITITESRDPTPGRLDVLSAILSIATMLPVVYGMKHLAEHARFDTIAAVSIAVGIVFGCLFVHRQRRLTTPLLDVSLFRSRQYSVAVITNVFGIFALVGALFFLPQYLQLVRGESPLVAGLWTLPAAGGAIAGALFASRLVQRARLSHVIGGGLVLAAGGFALAARLGVESALWTLAVGGALIGAGIGAAEALTNDVIIAAAPPDRAGAAAALSETAYELGGAMGIAVLGSIGTNRYRHELAGTAPAELPHDAGSAARETLGAASRVAELLPPELGEPLLAAARTAFTDAMTVAFWTTAAILLYGGAQVIVVLRRTT